MPNRKKLLNAALIVMIFSLLGKLFGFLREVIIASSFGTTFRSDAYFIGLTASDFFRDMISGSVLTAALIPIYASLLFSDTTVPKAKKVLNQTISYLSILLIITAIIGVLFSTQIVKLFAPEASPSTLILAGQLAKIMFPAIVFAGLAAFIGNILNVYNKFAVSSSNQILLNLGVITAVLTLSSYFGIKSLAIGIVFGSLMQFSSIIFSTKNTNISFSPDFEISDEFKKLFSVIIPLFLAAFLSTANDLVTRAIAAGLDTGSVAAFNFSNKIKETPWLLISVPIGTVLFPMLSTHSSKENIKKYTELLEFSIKTVTIVAAPVCVFIFFFSNPITKLIFERGVFNAASTTITSVALKYSMIGAFFYALNYVLLRAYYSTKNNKRVLLYSLLSVIVNIALGLALRSTFAIAGISLARSISEISFSILLFSGLILFIKDYRLKDAILFLITVIVISVVAVSTPYFLFNNQFQSIIVLLAVSSVFATVLFFLMGKLFKVSEINTLISRLRALKNAKQS